MGKWRVRSNLGTRAGWLLLVIGGGLMMLGKRHRVGSMALDDVGLGILLLAAVTFLAGRIAMFIRSPKG